MSLEFDVRLGQRDLDIGFDIGAGQTLALLGPNGAGKSSVLQLIAGQLRPDAGDVRLAGRSLIAPWVPAHARQVAMLAQDALLFPHLTARQNVEFGPRSRGSGRAEARRIAVERLEQVGMADLADRRPRALSGGQAQRVAVARALAADPQLLLLDEPLAALDVNSAPLVRRVLREVLAHRTALIVTHDPLDALALADRVVVLDGGRVIESGTATEVLTRPRSDFAARIAGLNLLAGTFDGDAVRLPDGRRVVGLSTEQLATGAPAVAVFRPSAVAVHRASPEGSPRNAFDVTITEMEPRGDVVRVRTELFAADVTLSAAAQLALIPGDSVHFAVKATEVAIHAARGT